ncbi:unnamed protein product, partial [Mesorhabditis belari]|uniref:Uncharacterized protein n=1 Tax=Mesorhabditis belari TaxID=2138241 RepID=A0AAF3F9E7_9BILA
MSCNNLTLHVHIFIDPKRLVENWQQITMLFFYSIEIFLLAVSLIILPLSCKILHTLKLFHWNLVMIYILAFGPYEFSIISRYILILYTIGVIGPGDFDLLSCDFGALAASTFRIFYMSLAVAETRADPNAFIAYFFYEIADLLIAVYGVVVIVLPVYTCHEIRYVFIKLVKSWRITDLLLKCARPHRRVRVRVRVSTSVSVVSTTQPDQPDHPDFVIGRLGDTVYLGATQEDYFRQIRTVW